MKFKCLFIFYFLCIKTSIPKKKSEFNISEELNIDYNLLSKQNLEPSHNENMNYKNESKITQNKIIKYETETSIIFKKLVFPFEFSFFTIRLIIFIVVIIFMIMVGISVEMASYIVEKKILKFTFG